MCAFAAQNLLPGKGRHIELVPRHVIGKDRRGCVGKGQARTVIGNPIPIGDAHARGGAIPSEDDIMGGIDRR